MTAGDPRWSAPGQSTQDAAPSVPPGGPWQPSPPQGGPSQPWQTLPPEQLARLHQPGIIPLRPLTVGDIFGGALTTMRRNPGATLGLALLVTAIFLVPSLLVSTGLSSTLTLAAEDETAILYLVSTAFSFLASVVLTGAIVHVVGEAVLGDRATIAETWAAVRPRLLALIGSTLLVTLAITGLTAALVAGVALVAWLLAQASGVAAVVVGVLLGLAAVVLLLQVAVRLTLAPAAVVLERIGPARAIARCWRLTTGGAGWRVLGITMLAAVLAGIFSTAVTVPVTFATGVLTGAVDPAAEPTLPLMLLDQALSALVSAVTTPFTAGVAALLYLDQRIRREGLEISLSRAAQDRAARRAR